MTTPYERSLERALSQNGALQPYALLFESLPTKVCALHPVDVVALLNASVMPDYGDLAIVVTATTLGFEGYGPEAATDLVAEFRRANPEFNPGMAMLVGAHQLDAMYGSIWGPLLAETLVRPEDQPILYQMLFGGIPGAAVLAQRRVMEHTWAARMKMRDGTYEPRSDTITEWQMRGSRVVPFGEAAHTFTTITDGAALKAVVVVDVLPENLYARPHPQS